MVKQRERWSKPILITYSKVRLKSRAELQGIGVAHGLWQERGRKAVAKRKARCIPI